MIIEVAFRFQDPEPRSKHVGNRFFGCGFTRGSGDADQKLAPQAPDGRAQGLKRSQSIVDSYQASFNWIACKLVLADDCGYGALVECLLDEVMAIHALAFDRKKKLPGPDRARVNRVGFGDRLVIEFAGCREEFGDP